MILILNIKIKERIQKMKHLSKRIKGNINKFIKLSNKCVQQFLLSLW